ncbi:FlaA1/EpsC-like NDP-sugar epimerase [Lewinella marina]|uniref:Nucleoside-diphosphate sugar epimerase n=1 Tax=Neolewinella marina TaxID=438751 RepID=A0A2G0CBY6_9BACT|nr:polysaccharide biosynthesis protein [Neolewinella marina]NJB86668.1 FlaA1/EpsC-like NDP-sugar epimerase [Neolewinella marina]PHK97476.1 nucleoside-diphosphate sugar epimerase [Neolewinella marina]
MKHFSLNNFISRYVTERDESLFTVDLARYHADLAREIDGKSALVIGGAGTIGSSFIRALLKFRPAKLYVVDTNENGLTELTRDLRSAADLNVPEDYKPYPINFGDPVFAKIMANEGPFDIVANFAAHKHVRSEKDHYSIEAMVDNNVLKAKHLLELLLAYPPKHFFCVSTDKAANPVNVMGASKKLMEEVILAYSDRLKISTARFANVAFSNGSLLFGFLERMMKEQPLSSPNDVRRYFVSPEESGQLCLLACVLGRSGEIFFPNLREEQMRTFSSIAVDFLREYGAYEPLYCKTEQEAREQAAQLTEETTHYPVYFFGSSTSGEKPYEEFFTEGENVDHTRFEQLGVIQNAGRKSVEEIEVMFAKLKALFKDTKIDKAAIVSLMADFIPNFEHIETGRSLDQKM